MRADLEPRQRRVRGGVGVGDPAAAGDDQQRRRQLLDQRPAEAATASPSAAAPRPARARGGRRRRRRLRRARSARASRRPAPRATKATGGARRRPPRGIAAAGARRQRHASAWHEPLALRRRPCRLHASAPSLNAPKPTIVFTDVIYLSGYRLDDEIAAAMIRYALRCDKAHRFDSWFGSSADFDRLRDSGLLACSVCGSTAVDKDLMAPGSPSRGAGAAALGAGVGGRAGAGRAPPADRGGIRGCRPRLRRRGAAHPRRRGAGALDHRRGAPAEARALVEDGIPVAPLPWAPQDQLTPPAPGRVRGAERRAPRRPVEHRRGAAGARADAIWLNLGSTSSPRRRRPRLHAGDRAAARRLACPRWRRSSPSSTPALYEAVAAASRLGLDVVVDVGHHEESGAAPGILADCARRLAGLPAWSRRGALPAPRRSWRAAAPGRPVARGSTPPQPSAHGAGAGPRLAARGAPARASTSSRLGTSRSPAAKPPSGRPPGGWPHRWRRPSGLGAASRVVGPGRS